MYENLPLLVAMLGIPVNVGYFNFIGNRIQSLEQRLDSRINSVATKLDLLTGKVIEPDNRLTRVEEQLKHHR